MSINDDVAQFLEQYVRGQDLPLRIQQWESDRRAQKRALEEPYRNTLRNYKPRFGIEDEKDFELNWKAWLEARVNKGLAEWDKTHPKPDK